MGNANQRNFKRIFKKWAAGQTTYTSHVPNNILSFVRYLFNGMKLAAVQPVENDTCFKKREISILRNCKPTVSRERNYFEITYDTVKIIFNGMWHIELPYTYSHIMCGTKCIFQHQWYVGRHPTHNQILDIVAIDMEMTTRRYYETSAEYKARQRFQERIKGRHHVPEMARKEKITCKICFVHKPTECIVPCGHVICPTCNYDWKRPICPFCRGIIERTIHMYN